MNTLSSFVAFGADHAGYGLKDRLAATLSRPEPPAGFPVLGDSGPRLLARDFGTNGPESVDYPDFARLVCQAVISGEARFGVLVCGTGIGMSIAANRFPGIRCALIHDITGARLTRMHNDANVIAFGARLIGEEVALDALRVFLATPYEGGRHDRRIAKLNASASAPAGEHNLTSIGAT